ncbi:MAG: hypothetical protein E6G29_08940 [Actinobacteria bacterium]|nr:MAG: hypothetical protein E6G29_08940 [Actinomycetota bacterium]
MTWIRQARRGAAIGAIALAALGASAASASGASLKIKAPSSINRNKDYKVKASGVADHADYLIVFFQHVPCQPHYADDQRVASGWLIHMNFKKVGPGAFSAKSVKLRGGSRGGTVTYCGYLQRRGQSIDSGPEAFGQGHTNFT